MTDPITDNKTTATTGRLADKVVLITGGASGIGAGCAERLAREGAIIVVSDVDSAAGKALANAINANAGRALFLPHDVTDEAQWQRVMQQINDRYGRLDVLVNNAGVGIGGSIVDMTLADWRWQQAINLDGVFLGVKHGIPLMRAGGGGSIINMSSVAGLKGNANLAAYNATKGGVRLFTKGVALECAQKGWAIRVNSVHPGVIDTPIWTKVNPEFLAEGENSVDIEGMAAAVPNGILGKPLDIANGVLFLASDESAYITGTELTIDGGLSA